MPKIHPIAFAAVVAAIALALPAHATDRVTACHPRDNTARVLATPSPNAIHPDWQGESYLGVSWFLVVNSSTTVQPTGNFLRGNLYSSRGGLTDRNVWVVSREWRCKEERVDFDANGNVSW